MFAYFPTIKDLLKGLPSANFYTYALRFVYYLISVLYGIFILDDWLFVVVSGFDALFLACIVVLIIRVQRGEIVQDLRHKKVRIVDKVKCRMYKKQH
jgi:hypothetical protein